MRSDGVQHPTMLPAASPVRFQRQSKSSSNVMVRPSMFRTSAYARHDVALGAHKMAFLSAWRQSRALSGEESYKGLEISEKHPCSKDIIIFQCYQLPMPRRPCW